ncbi:MAG TPA: endopeptidase La [Candidatus Sumerlaeota bacterium]|nr:MAG: Lon protease 1 [candidate division BRC1 bacterium ADurb.Bin183]HOE63863.1 endopeptidase La [Candidatus Sumerlaeota bacterium]HRR32117.1 endopeptidase La [Candidatus Sumerlaeia bacterium]HON49967.1 endopeptidase La [Candidatus Sumerlaeota bacterium]HOR63785.1 endopeptidase La [Candidatus Sumerlaeota bacterium]
MKESDNIILPVIPLRDMVPFPNSINPVIVFRPRSFAAMEHALGKDKRVCLLAQRLENVENPEPADLYNVGVVGEIVESMRDLDNQARLLVEGLYPVRVLNFLNSGAFINAIVVRQQIQIESNKRIEAQKRALIKQLEEYYRLSDRIPDELYFSIRVVEDTLAIVDSISNYVPFKKIEKQKVLEETKLEKKMERLIRLLSSENEILKIESDIMDEVRDRIGKNQKEIFLSEQLKVIEKELGIPGEDESDLQSLKKTIAKSKLPKEALEKAEKEFQRLRKMAPLSPEATVSLTYLDWLAGLPWGKKTKDNLDLDRAQRILDKGHYGLEKVKERILEYLAVHQLVTNPKGPILCFVGPPGVGKTSLARSISETLNRKFVRVSLGGVRDEAEIRGHRRTYVGALPGKIIQSMKKAGSMNPVFLLDEIDKLTKDFHGDPSAALLEVLDPEQNKAFNDHFLDVDFDLSSVMFITTANVGEDIHRTLLDRMEIIHLPGYTREEKIEIARQFLIPRQIKEHGLSRRNVRFTNEIIASIINEYTREAGVRNLEREIAKICRKFARELVRKKKTWSESVSIERIRKLLGPPRFKDQEKPQDSEVGVATGLAWTELGGEILPTETTVVKGKGVLTLTGQMGNVMQESAKAALTYIRSRSKKFNLRDNFYNQMDIHVHIPEGAIPKDGPSAGVTMATSMLSAISKRPVRQDVAMTGEITLRGRVLKIGGLKEKILAAHRAHIKTIIIPRENKDDLDELPKEVRKDIHFILVNNLDEVLDSALLAKNLPSKPS